MNLHPVCVCVGGGSCVPAHSECLHKTQLREQSRPHVALFHCVYWIRVLWIGGVGRGSEEGDSGCYQKSNRRCSVQLYRVNSNEQACRPNALRSLFLCGHFILSAAFTEKTNRTVILFCLLAFHIFLFLLSFFFSAYLFIEFCQSSFITFFLDLFQLLAFVLLIVVPFPSSAPYALYYFHFILFVFILGIVDVYCLPFRFLD